MRQDAAFFKAPDRGAELVKFTTYPKGLLRLPSHLCTLATEGSRAHGPAARGRETPLVVITLYGPARPSGNRTEGGLDDWTTGRLDDQGENYVPQKAV